MISRALVFFNVGVNAIAADNCTINANNFRSRRPPYRIQNAGEGRTQVSNQLTLFCPPGWTTEGRPEVTTLLLVREYHDAVR